MKQFPQFYNTLTILRSLGFSLCQPSPNFYLPDVLDYQSENIQETSGEDNFMGGYTQ